MTATLALSTMIEEQAGVPESEINLLALCINKVVSIKIHHWLKLRSNGNPWRILKLGDGQPIKLMLI
jgi:hypothetical protein